MRLIRGIYVRDLLALYSPGALQSAQISVDGRSFILEDIVQAIEMEKTLQPCLIDTYRSINANNKSYKFPLPSFFDSRKNTPAYLWSASHELVMRHGYRLSSLNRFPLGRSSNVPRNSDNARAVLNE